MDSSPLAALVAALIAVLQSPAADSSARLAAASALVAAARGIDLATLPLGEGIAVLRAEALVAAGGSR